jgi:hypothetical protein
MHDRFHISALASGVALDPLRRVIRLVLYWQTATASKRPTSMVLFRRFLHATLTSAGAMKSKYSPDGSVQSL